MYKNIKSPKKKKTHKSQFQKKSDQRNSFWLYGKHPVLSVILKQRRKIYKILITKNNQQVLDNFLLDQKIDIDKSIIKIVSSEEISKIFFSEKVMHQGFALHSSYLDCISDNDFLSQLKTDQKLDNILILDQLTDPHNIGAIIRSSVAFGINNIVLLKQSFNSENATMCKSSCGAIESANIILVGNLNSFILNLKDHGYWVAGLDGYGEDSFEILRKYDNICLIVGSEGSGIRKLVKKNCDLLLKIPISGNIESLNASNAAAIALWEITRSK